MAFKVVASLDADIVYALGKRNKTTGKTDPDQIEGYYLGNRTTEGGKFGPSKLHFLQTPKGNVGVWGKSDMDKKLGVVTPGTMVRISTNGTRETKFGTQQVYKVEEDKTNSIEVDISESAPAYDDGGDTDSNDYHSGSDDNDDDVQNAALLAAERAAKAAKVQELLNKNKRK